MAGKKEGKEGGKKAGKKERKTFCRAYIISLKGMGKSLYIPDIVNRNYCIGVLLCVWMDRWVIVLLLCTCMYKLSEACSRYH